MTTIMFVTTVVIMTLSLMTMVSNRDAGNTAFAQGCGTGDAQVSFWLHILTAIITMHWLNQSWQESNIIQATRHFPVTTRHCLLLQPIHGTGR